MFLIVDSKVNLFLANEIQALEFSEKKRYLFWNLTLHAQFYLLLDPFRSFLKVNRLLNNVSKLS